MNSKVNVEMDEIDEMEILEEEDKVGTFWHQALWVFAHTVLALGSWALMMTLITMANPQSVSVLITLALSFTAPFIVGFIFNRIKQNEMGPYVWLIGMIWFLIVCLWILDMPTGPNQCYHCDASEKIYLTFFSWREDSGLIDGQGRFVGTWPFAAFIGYAVGSSLALKRKKA